MGNHDVGRGMHAAAKAYFLGREHAGTTVPLTKKDALAALDAMVKAGDWRGADAEFDDHLDDKKDPLRELVLLAFGPWTKEDRAMDKKTEGDHWYEKIIKPFSKRYGFC